ncbi:hypothetical protein GCM10010174_03310 [Kutzneria viridogrisea]|uniref:Sensor histidine kinase n=1 Tax=Kutzneria viridogrisea TaxID=47990 RepID=A0ABR6BS43_9PSEU|nr:hypothetical protein [Kutzneria viridogrisea]
MTTTSTTAGAAGERRRPRVSPTIAYVLLLVVIQVCAGLALLAVVTEQPWLCGVALVLFLATALLDHRARTRG